MPNGKESSDTVNILLAASEVAPFAKTGGLADVAGSLPKHLKALGHDVRVVLPCYKTVKERFRLDDSRVKTEIDFDGGTHRARLLTTRLETLPVYFVDAPAYFDRDGLYGYGDGDYPDNALRFGFFSKALLELLKPLGWSPDIVFVNDWQTGLVPVFLKTLYGDDPFYAKTGSFLSIHNLGYQGLFPPEVLPRLGLPSSLNRPDGVEYHGQISFLKGGVLFADTVGTVSETYSEEIQTPELGFGFDGIFAQRGDKLAGILNGLDRELWNPATDTALPAEFDATDLRGKSICKEALQRELGLMPVPDTPMVAMVTRLDTQKGIDLLEEGWSRLMERPLQFVLLGTGSDAIVERFTRLKGKKGQISMNLAFDDGLARRIYAGSDLFLMPSRYEPCGLGQLIALRYGSLPIVRSTGGLADTVTDIGDDPTEGNGFVFDEYSVGALLNTVDRALETYEGKSVWDRCVRNAITCDFSWTRSAKRYEEIFETILEKKQYVR